MKDQDKTNEQLIDELVNLRRRNDELEKSEVEYKRELEKMRDSENKYRDIVELAPDGIVTISLKGVVTSCNSSFLNISGYSEDEIIGKHFTKLPTLHLRDMPKYIKMFNSLIRGKSQKPLEIEWTHKDKTTHQAEVLTSIMRKGRKIVGIQGIARDITERKRAEEALKESEERFKALAENSPDVIARQDKNTRFLYINPAVKNLMGISPESMIGKTNSELGMPKEIEEFWQKKIDKVYKTKKAEVFETKTELYEGEKYFQCISVPEFNSQGKMESVLTTSHEITERKRVEAALCESEEKFRLLSDQNLMGIIIIQDGLVKYVNKVASQITEYSIEEALDWKPNEFGKLFHSDDLEFVMEQAQKKQEGAKDIVTHYSYRIITKTGKVKWIDQYSKTISLAEKYADLITIIDITERKMAEEKLQESEEKYRSLMESTDDSVYAVDGDCRYIYMNEKNLSRLGVPSDKVIGKMYSDFHTKAGTEKFKKRIKQVLRTGKSITHEYQSERDGKFFLRTYSPVRKQDAKLNTVIIISKDITERKLAEEALRESELQYRTLGETIPYGVWLTDAMGYCTYVSDSFLELVDMTMEQIQHFGWLHLLPPEDVQSTKDHWLHCVQTGENFEREHRFRSKDGSYRNVLAIGRPIRNDTGEIVKWVGINLDITERKRAENARASVYNISEATQTAKTLEELSRLIHETITELMPAKDNFYIALYDENADMLNFPYFVDEFEENPGPQKLGKGLTEYVLRTGEPLLASPKVFEKLEKEGEVVSIGPSSIDWLGVPLKVKDKTIGILVIQSYTEGLRYSENEKDILMFISEQVAMVIERKKAEEVFKQSEERYHSLFNLISDAVYVIDQETGRVLDVNETACKMYGYTRKEWLKMKNTDVSVEPAETKKATEDSPETIPIRYHKKKDGTVFPLEMTLNTIELKGRRAIIATARDITERKRAEEQLMKSQEELHKLAEHLQTVREEERTSIARELHDDIGQNLAALKIEMHLLDRELPKDKKLIHDRIEFFMELTDRMADTVGAIYTELRPPLLDELGLEGVVGWYQRIFQERVEIKCDLQVELEGVNLSDHFSLAVFRIIQESLTNVRLHSEATRVKVILREKGGKLELIVKDNGIGITEEQIEEPKAFGIMGMEERVRNLGGEIKIKGIEGKGTTVTARIPLQADNQDQS